VRAIIELAHALGLRVVAEGVESRAQLALLRTARCDDVQGYLMSRPLGPVEFAEWARLRLVQAP
jgi:EAL domain-containing protein (putative c-di-GMP-specific phosphodiesterase class I)